MFKLILFFLLPLLSATELCENGTCLGSIKPRVISGSITERHSRPFQAALYSRVGSDGELGFCGGSLISQQWVITAAHCCYHGQNKVDNVQAILGAHSLYDRYENGRRILNVNTIEVHPNFNQETFANDLALLQLANIVQKTDTVNVIRLPYRSMVNSNFAGASALASGWGIAAENVPFVSPTLREYSMTVMTDPQCDSTYLNQLPPDVVCGFSVTSGTCKGDNGGPMTIFNAATEETILVGVASFVHISGCNTNVPSVFTRVQRHLDWISQVTGMTID